MKTNHSFMPMRRLLMLLVLIGTFALADRAGQAAPSNTTALQDAIAPADTGDVLALPADPIIEEPLRPLLPEGLTLPLDASRRCGSMPLFLLPIGLLLMQAMRPSYFR